MLQTEQTETPQALVLVITTTRRIVRRPKTHEGQRHFHTSHKAWTEQPLTGFQQTRVTTLETYIRRALDSRYGIFPFPNLHDVALSV